MGNVRAQKGDKNFELLRQEHRGISTGSTRLLQQHYWVAQEGPGTKARQEGWMDLEHW